jgi:predicted enzyme related to lactoylglutathione lyase
VDGQHIVMTGEPSHFELGVPDKERGRAFYNALFGWKIDEIGWIDTGGVRGGLHGDDPETGVVLYFAVDDIDAAVRRVRELGGEADEPGPIEESGRYTSCRDDQGVVFGLREPPR